MHDAFMTQAAFLSHSMNRDHPNITAMWIIHTPKVPEPFTRRYIPPFIFQIVINNAFGKSIIHVTTYSWLAANFQASSPALQ